jgi:hypothetical protein
MMALTRGRVKVTPQPFLGSGEMPQIAPIPLRRNDLFNRL